MPILKFFLFFEKVYFFGYTPPLLEGSQKNIPFFIYKKFLIKNRKKNLIERAPKGRVRLDFFSFLLHGA